MGDLGVLIKMMNQNFSKSKILHEWIIWIEALSMGVQI